MDMNLAELVFMSSHTLATGYTPFTRTESEERGRDLSAALLYMTVCIGLQCSAMVNNGKV